MPSTQSSAFECTFDYRFMPNYGNDFFHDTEEQRFPTTESTFGYGSTPNHGNDFFLNTEEQKFPTTKNYSLFCDCDDVDCDRPLDDMETMPQF